MAAKAFYVSRTETEGQPSGAATLNRADAPQLLKIVPVDNSTGNPDPATPVDNMIYATEDGQEILFTSDTVQSGDLNPVTSDAVYSAIQNLAFFPDWSNPGTSVDITSSKTFTATANGWIILRATTASSGSHRVFINSTRIGSPNPNTQIYQQFLVKAGDTLTLEGDWSGSTVSFVPCIQ